MKNDYLKNIENAGTPSGLETSLTSTHRKVEGSNITKDSQKGTTYLEPRRVIVKRFVLKK